MKKRQPHFQLSIFNFQLFRFQLFRFQLFLALAFASCADKDTTLPAEARGISVEVTLPDGGNLSRSVPTAPAGHVLRCVLEARANADNSLRARVERLAEGTTSLSFKFDLHDAGKYTLALWADYIDENATAAETTLEGVTFRHYSDKYYGTVEDNAGLRHVTVIPYSTDATDYRDAFTGTLAFTKGSTASTDLSVTLARPLSRVTVAEKTAANADFCATVTAAYKVPAAIDASTGELVAGEQTDVTLSATPSPDATVTVSGTPCRVLFSDLVLAPANTTGGSLGDIALAFTPTEAAAGNHVLPPLTIPAGIPTRRGYRVNAAGNLVAPTTPHSRVILAVDINDTWTTPDVEINPLYIPDEKFRAFCISSGYADAEGNIIPAKAAKATGIDVSDLGIASLEGIGYFTALKKLHCYSNSITSLDVSGCKALETLYCNDNSSLASLDVSGCEALEILDCSNNRITSLDVSGCEVLKTLSCSNNRITSLDVSECEVLERLLCSDNRLTTLDVSRCKALEYLSCHTNRLTTLDVSECEVLERLFCSDNRLTTLDVSRCKALEYLSCHTNRLTTLDVSGTLKNAAYDLYCGNQKDEEGNPRELALTLAESQRERWNNQLSNNPNNPNNTNVKLLP